MLDIPPEASWGMTGISFSLTWQDCVSESALQLHPMCCLHQDKTPKSRVHAKHNHTMQHQIAWSRCAPGTVSRSCKGCSRLSKLEIKFHLPMAAYICMRAKCIGGSARMAQRTGHAEDEEDEEEDRTAPEGNKR